MCNIMIIKLNVIDRRNSADVYAVSSKEYRIIKRSEPFLKSTKNKHSHRIIDFKKHTTFFQSQPECLKQ